MALTDQTARELIEAAKRLCERLWPTSLQRLPDEIMLIDDKTVGSMTAAIVTDQDGIDYMLTMTVLSKQRDRGINQ